MPGDPDGVHIPRQQNVRHPEYDAQRHYMPHYSHLVHIQQDPNAILQPESLAACFPSRR